MNLNGKNVLVTGADGFIGSHLVENLVQKGANVKALSLYNSFNSWGWLENSCYLDEFEVISGDVRDPFLCKEITKNIDFIFHLAALIAIPYSYISPNSYIETNVNGTLNICQAALFNNCSKLIHISTSEVYGTALYVPIDEKHPLQPQSPYSASKIAADSIALSFFHSFNLPLLIGRPFNTYGPRQSARAFIPTIITQLAKGKTLIKLGDVSPTRDLNYVEDTVEGIISLLSIKNKNGEVFNIGSNKEISIEKTFELIKNVMNIRASYEVDNQRIRPKDSEVKRLWCDNSKLFNESGFIPKYSIEEGIKLTIDWFSKQENLTKYKSEIYNV